VNNHNQDARVYGDNNVVGHGNTITRNEIHNHNQSGGSGGSGGGGDKNESSNGEEGLGVVIALGSAIAISVWRFVGVFDVFFALGGLGLGVKGHGVWRVVDGVFISQLSRGSCGRAATPS
jgi:hypothetical protein